MSIPVMTCSPSSAASASSQASMRGSLHGSRTAVDSDETPCHTRHVRALGLVLVSAVVLLPPSAAAHPGGVSLSGEGTATVDGVVTAGEWAHAAELPFDAN